jgi:hydroxymethylpyrimidine pyrophosphatase-like HAD family hydrolase
MEIYKELDDLGFFKWYCTQYGSLVYQEYKPVYDNLPLDNIITTELNACVFKFFREKYDLHSSIESYNQDENGNDIEYIYSYRIVTNKIFPKEMNVFFNSHEEAELECIKKLIKIVTK